MISRPDLKITDLLKMSPFTRSAEIVPPRNGVSAEVILNQIESLTTAGAQFLAVTKGAGGSLRGGSLPIAMTIKERFHVPCIAHFTCRDLLPEEVESNLIDHHMLGIRNILALRGDPPAGTAPNSPEAICRPGSHPYAYQLVEQIRELNKGQYFERDNFKVINRERTSFCIGVACYPDSVNPKERIDYLKQKVDAGAEYAITQMLFSADSYARYVDDCAKAGIHIPILPGIRIARSRPQAERIAKRFNIHAPESLLSRLPTDDKNPSATQVLEAFAGMTDRLQAVGAPGIHLFVLSDVELASMLLGYLNSQAQTKPLLHAHG